MREEPASRPAQAIALIPLHEWRELLNLKDNLTISNITVDKAGTLHLLLEGDGLCEIYPGGQVPSYSWKDFVSGSSIDRQHFSLLDD